MGDVMAIDKYRSNADLILACQQLGYLSSDALTLDPTYGNGTFWRLWKPEILIATDIDPLKSPGTWTAVTGRWASSYGSVDFRDLYWMDGAFDAVVFDPPYKLNGTPSEPDAQYGCDDGASAAERREAILFGLAECIRVLHPGGHLLVKCQDQVVSGRVVWQTDIITRAAEANRCTKIDRLDFLSYRPQPSGRRQVHARRNHSTMLVFRKAAPA